MAIPTFVQKSRINQVIYQIRDGQLLISERELLGKFRDRELKLQWIDPEYSPGITRNYMALIISLLLAALCGMIVWGGLKQTTVPREAIVHIIQWPALCLAVFFTAAVQWSRRIEYYRFNNQAGRPVLVIIREREQADECAAFITTLVAHIQLAQSDLSPDARTKILRELSFRPGDPPVAPGKSLWLASIICGSLASGLPWLLPTGYPADPSVFPFIFLLCTGGVAGCMFSHVQKEPNRWWSVLGLILGLIPPFFY